MVSRYAAPVRARVTRANTIGKGDKMKEKVEVTVVKPKRHRKISACCADCVFWLVTDCGDVCTFDRSFKIDDPDKNRQCENFVSI